MSAPLHDLNDSLSAPSAAGAAAKIHQYGFGIVVCSVGSCNPVTMQQIRSFIQKPIPQNPCSLFRPDMVFRRILSNIA